MVSLEKKSFSAPFLMNRMYGVKPNYYLVWVWIKILQIFVNFVGALFLNWLDLKSHISPIGLGKKFAIDENIYQGEGSEIFGFFTDTIDFSYL